MSQYAALSELNMSFLKEIYPDKHELATQFIDSFKSAVDTWVTPLEKDTPVAIKLLDPYRQPGSTVG